MRKLSKNGNVDNAIKACEQITDESKRQIKITCIDRPDFAIGIYNTYEGKVLLNDECVPISQSPDHGYSTQSIQTFALKHNAVLYYDIGKEWFKLRLVINKLNKQKNCRMIYSS